MVSVYAADAQSFAIAKFL